MGVESIYQKIINLASVFLVSGSIIVIGIVFILVYHFHLTDLDFWAPIFSKTPKAIFIVGIFTFVVGIYGIIISNLENRLTLSILAVLLSFVLVLQFFPIYYINQLNSEINFFNSTSPEFTLSLMSALEEVKHYEDEDWEWVKPKWDRIQSGLRCCGSSDSFNYGYHDYQAAYAFKRNRGGQPSVPDSCCKEQSEGCGIGKYDDGNMPNPTFYVDGCMSILPGIIRTEGIQVLRLYMKVALLLLLVKIFTVIITVIYIVKIRRNVNNTEKYSRSDENEASQKLIKK